MTIRKKKPWGLQKPPVGWGQDWSHPLSKGLVAHWFFNEGAGGKVYDIAKNNHGAFVNGPLWRAGKFGKALSFDGSTQNVTFFGTAPLVNLSRGFTLSAWIKLTSVTGTYGIISNGSGSWYLRVNSSKLNFLQSYVADIGYSNTALVINRWYFAVVTVSSDSTATITFYLNGNRDGTTSYSGSFSRGYNSGSIGSDTTYHYPDVQLNDFFAGSIDDVRVYNRALTPSEIQSLYTAPFQDIQAPTRRWLNSGAGAFALSGASSSGAVGTAPPTIAAPTTGNSSSGSIGAAVPQFAVPATGNASSGAVGTALPTTAASATGNASSGAVGTAVPQIALALSGAAATGYAGTMSVTGFVTLAMTGNAATGGTGTLAASIALALTGDAASGAVGIASPSFSLTALGNAVSGALGSVGPQILLALTGDAATGGVGTLTPPGATVVALTGNAATGYTGTATVSIGTALTGTAASGAIGVVTPGIARPATGVGSTGSVGSVVLGINVRPSGVSATGAVGNLLPAGGTLTIALTGNLATGAVGTLTAGTGVPSGLVVEITVLEVNTDVYITRQMVEYYLRGDSS